MLNGKTGKELLNYLNMPCLYRKFRNILKKKKV